MSNIIESFNNKEIKISGYNEDITVKIINIEADNYSQTIDIITHIYIGNDTKNYVVKTFNMKLLEFLGYDTIEDIFENTEIVNNFINRFTETIQSHNDMLPLSAIKEYLFLKLENFLINNNSGLYVITKKDSYEIYINDENDHDLISDSTVCFIQFNKGDIIIENKNGENIGIYKDVENAYNFIISYLISKYSKLEQTKN